VPRFAGLQNERQKTSDATAGTIDPQPWSLTFHASRSEKISLLLGITSIRRLEEVQDARHSSGAGPDGHGARIPIVFACVGVAMPLLMVIAGWLHLKIDDEVYYTLARVSRLPSPRS
jgi:hypothetical protein